MMIQILIFGRPNVGKSSLFNALLKERIAITSDLSGTTRDFNKKLLRIGDLSITLVDSAGLENNKSLLMDYASRVALVLFVVDGRSAPHEEELIIFKKLLGLTKCALIVNKIDDERALEHSWEFNAFGSSDIFFTSVVSKRGIGKLLDFLETFSKEFRDVAPVSGEQEINDRTSSIRVGIIGRVNTGKSSLLNSLVGVNRALVSNVPGTTLDPVDERITFNSHEITFIDTAGIRQRGKIKGVEKYALERTDEVLSRCDIAILLLDASTNFVDLDEKISAKASYKTGVIIALNKWDIKRDTYEKLRDEFRRKFAYLHFAPLICISANTKRNIEELKSKIIEVHANLHRRISTSVLNDLIARSQRAHPLPSFRGKMAKIFYATQITINPPSIVLKMNYVNALHFSYERYLINCIRKEFDFSGVPIKLIAKPNKNDDKNEDA